MRRVYFWILAFVLGVNFLWAQEPAFPLTLNLKKGSSVSNLSRKGTTSIANALLPDIVFYQRGSQGLGKPFFATSPGEIFQDSDGLPASLSLWIRLKKEVSGRIPYILILKGEKGELKIRVLPGTHQYYALLRGKSKVVLSSIYDVPLADWHHIVINFSADKKAELFVDGCLQDNGVVFSDGLGSIKEVSLGNVVADVSDLLVLSRPLVAGEVQELFNLAANLPGSSPLVTSALEEKNWNIKTAYKDVAGNRNRVCLNGLWRIQPAEGYNISPLLNEWGYLRVPGSWRCPVFNFYQDEITIGLKAVKEWQGKRLDSYVSGWYQRQFSIPEEFTGKHIYIKFDNLGADYARIYLNGKLISSFVNTSPYFRVLRIPREVEVTNLLRDENTLTLYLFRSFTYWKQYLDLMDTLETGVYDVWLEARSSSEFIKSIVTFPSYRKKELRIKVRIANPSEKKGERFLSGDIYFEEKKQKHIPLTTLESTGKREQIAWLTLPWEKPLLWSAETPYLYQLSLSLTDQKRGVIDKPKPITFGFREFWIEDGNFILNGKKTRLRIWSSTRPMRRIPYYLATEQGADALYRALKGLNYDTLRYAPIGSKSLQLGWRGYLNTADRIGFYHLQPVPPYEGVRSYDKYCQDVEQHIETWGNHPSIIMWFPTFNTCSYRWDQEPSKLADVDYVPQHKIQARTYAQKAEDTLRRYDPSREVFHHAGGNMGKVFGSMNYQSFGVPLQEQEDWPSLWSKKHTQPLMSVESDFPYTSQFLQFDLEPRRGKAKKPRREYLVAEHAARYFGEEAYLNEKVPTSQASYSWWRSSDNPNYLSVKALLHKQIIRAWRGYDMSGLGCFGSIGQYFKFIPKMKAVYPSNDSRITFPGLRPDNPGGMRHIFVDLSSPNPLHQVFKEALSPLLVFIGGEEGRFTNKDHSFFSGEEANKSIMVINDHLYATKLRFLWQCQDEKGKTIAQGEETRKIDAGEIVQIPIKIKAPSVRERTNYQIKLKVFNDMGKVVTDDSFFFQVFPMEKVFYPEKDKIVLYDPVGETAKLLSKAGINFVNLKKLSDVDDADLLIIGKDVLGEVSHDILTAIEKSGKIEKGLNILVFEQKPCNLGNLIFEATSQRYVFMQEPNHPVLAGLRPEDFINWRGDGDMVEAYSVCTPKSETTPHYPRAKWKWGNTGIVASNVIRKPQFGNFIPILECGFDLMNTPLLEWRQGKGMIIISQLDATVRYGIDPVATKLVNNLFSYMLKKHPISSLKTAYLGGEKEKVLLERMGADLEIINKSSPLPKADILILGSGQEQHLKENSQKIKKFVSEGGKVFCFPQQDFSWLPFEMTTSNERPFRALLPEKREGIFKGLSQADFYYRKSQDIVTINKIPGAIFTEPGMVAEVKDGKGVFVFCQLDAEKIKEFWAPEKTCRVINLVLSNLGVSLANNMSFFGNIKYMHNQKGALQIALTDWKFKLDKENQGLTENWQRHPETMAGWQKIALGPWENQGITQSNPSLSYAPGLSGPGTVSYAPYDGYAWYKTRVHIPADWKDAKIYFEAGVIDDFDWTYFNGQKIGQITDKEEPKYFYEVLRRYRIPANLIKFGKDNWIMIRVFDRHGAGGIVKGPVRLVQDEAIIPDAWSPYADKIDLYDVNAFHNW